MLAWSGATFITSYFPSSGLSLNWITAGHPLFLLGQTQVRYPFPATCDTRHSVTTRAADVSHICCKHHASTHEEAHHIVTCPRQIFGARPHCTWRRLGWHGSWAQFDPGAGEGQLQVLQRRGVEAVRHGSLRGSRGPLSVGPMKSLPSTEGVHIQCEGIVYALRTAVGCHDCASGVRRCCN